MTNTPERNSRLAPSLRACSVRDRGILLIIVLVLLLTGPLNF
jgi:hypothetical protein